VDTDTYCMADRRGNPDGDWVERRGPETWRGIAACGAASAAGLPLVLVGVGGLWEAAAAILFAISGFQVLRGLLRMAWLVRASRPDPNQVASR
jgi:purine-cytosine permease-like protein